MNRRKKLALLLWNIGKHSIETSLRRSFCSIIGKRGTDLAHSFLMSKFSFIMRCKALFVSHIILFFGFSSPPCSSWQLLRPRLNSATQYFIIVNEGADSPRVESSSILIVVGLRTFKWKYCIRYRWPILSMFTISPRAFTIDSRNIPFSIL